MTHVFVRRSLLGLVLALLGLVALVLRTTPASSAATSSDTSAELAAQAPEVAAVNWNGWQNMGDLNGKSVRDPVIGQNQDGHLEIFAWADYASSYAVYRRNQTAPNGSSWTAWTYLGALGSNTRFPAVATNPAGRMEVLAQALVTGGTCTSQTEIKQIWQTAPNNGWNNWVSMGVPNPFPCDDLYPPYIGMNADGRLDVFAGDLIGDVYHRWQTSPNGSWSTGWSGLGSPSGVTLWSSRLGVGRNADGRLAVFALGANSEVYHIWQNTVGNEISWSGWTGLGNPGVNLYYPVVGQNQDGRLDVFAIGTGGNLWHIWQVAPNSYWSGGWENLGHPAPGTLSGEPRVSRTRDGRQVVFSAASDGAIWSIAQTQASGYWGSWTSLGKPPGVVALDSVTVGKNQNGSLVIAAVGSYSGVLWLNSERIQLFLPFVHR